MSALNIPKGKGRAWGRGFDVGVDVGRGCLEYKQEGGGTFVSDMISILRQ